MIGKILVIPVFVNLFLFACTERSYKREFVIANSKSFEASLFRQHCAICHGQEANGKELADGRLVPSLRYGEAAKKSEGEIYQQIKNGKLPMPSFKDQLTEEEINKLVKFVMQELQGRK